MAGKRCWICAMQAVVRQGVRQLSIPAQACASACTHLLRHVLLDGEQRLPGGSQVHDAVHQILYRCWLSCLRAPASPPSCLILVLHNWYMSGLDGWDLPHKIRSGLGWEASPARFRQSF